MSFESDDEGNFQQNQKRAAEIARKFSENDSDFIDGDDDDEDSESNECDDGEDEESDAEDDNDANSDRHRDDVAEESENESDDEHVEGSDSELSFEENESLDGEESNRPKETVKNVVKKAVKSKKLEIKGHSIGSAAATNTESSKPKVSAAVAFKNELNGRKPSEKAEIDEYEEHDTDDEEDIRNTVGNIPMKWYDEYKHIGYDWDAKKIIKPAKRDHLDDFLKRMEDPDFWRTVKDPQTGQDVILSDADIDLIKRINAQRIPDANFDDYTVNIF